MKFRLFFLIIVLIALPVSVFATTDLSTLSYTDNSFNIGSTGLNVTFSEDGTKMYRSATYGTSAIYQYSLSTPWDLSTASYVDSGNVSSNGITNIDVSSDGTTMFVTHFYSDVMYQYTLGTAWDITTISYASKAKSLGYGNHYASDVRADGSAIYAVNSWSDDIKQFNLSTPWDLSTVSASHDASLSTPTGLGYYKTGTSFNSDGTNFYLLTTNSSTADSKIYEYELSEAYNIGTASLTGETFSLTDQSAGMRGLFIDSDDQYLFTYGQSSGTQEIFRYSFSPPDTTAPSVSITYPEAGDYLSGSSTISATSTDNVAVASVQFYIDDVAEGSADTEAPYSISWDSASVDDGEYEAFAVATDSSGNVATSTSVSFNVLNSSLAVSDVASSPNSSGATISWTTNQAASSKVYYGTTDSLGSETSESDTSPRVTGHSVAISGLDSCTQYYYKAESKNSVLVTATSSVKTFETTGCSVPDDNNSSGGGGVSLYRRIENRIEANEIESANKLILRELEDELEDDSTSIRKITRLIEYYIDANGTQVAEIAEQENVSEEASSQTSIDIIFPYNLRPQMIDVKVKTLQEFLNQNGFVVADGGAGSPGNETEYFGSRTQGALVRFQEYYRDEVLIPAGVQNGTGILGQFSREFINKSFSFDLL